MTRHGYEELLAPNHYYDRHFQTEAAKILPGEYYVTGREMMLVTVLGSCVSACIRDPVAGVGGMNHFMLPEGGDVHNPLSACARYGGYAMEILLNQLLKLGASRTRLEAKVFGGGAIMRGFTLHNVGERNSDFVLEYLARERIRVTAEDLRDIYPRKVYFFPVSGRVLVKKLKRVHNDTIVQREQEYGSRLQTADMAGDVELFA
ncbi:chemoreceptor glutamine deamidase CheD [Parasulfuritortus cantonensis]|uniref:Probable chemoreceptor glutamine deamidase CheD n=1 Tax=Parasulfuritortus cantonensis TaxID=2528202 RepID=A0A4R1BIQ5_9PROT|nr:chemoreceptor glutamine deamidase CheD [Parasulfuritortus cantonensis]TCJ17151.1 chemoreceptor glutamine deamidase CheD [Parasulfuritortus cantonensis]